MKKFQKQYYLHVKESIKVMAKVVFFFEREIKIGSKNGNDYIINIREIKAIITIRDREVNSDIYFLLE